MLIACRPSYVRMSLTFLIDFSRATVQFQLNLAQIFLGKSEFTFAQMKGHDHFFTEK